MRIILICMAVVVSLATGAAAQTADQDAALRRLAAHAEADQIIAAAADAAPLFENVTTDEVPTVRHRMSGLICPFELGHPQNAIVLYDGLAAPGEDVSCTMNRSDGTMLTYYAFRYPEPYTTDFLFEDARRAIVERWPEARPFEGSLAVATSEAVPESREAAFIVPLDGVEHFSFLRVARVGDWTFKVRRTQRHTPRMEDLAADSVMWLLGAEAALGRQADR